jgi:hypothetical protein
MSVASHFTNLGKKARSLACPYLSRDSWHLSLSFYPKTLGMYLDKIRYVRFQNAGIYRDKIRYMVLRANKFAPHTVNTVSEKIAPYTVYGRVC